MHSKKAKALLPRFLAKTAIAMSIAAAMPAFSDAQVTLIEPAQGKLNMGLELDNMAKLGDSWITAASTSTGQYGNELYIVTNGQASLLADIIPGSASSRPKGLVAFGDRAYFATQTENLENAELWTTDGTAAGTEKVLEFDEQTSPYTTLRSLEVGGKLFLKSTGDSLVVIDGKTNNPATFFEYTILDYDNAGAFPNYGLQPVGNKVIFNGHKRGNSQNEKLWVTDGSLAGTMPLLDSTGSELSEADKAIDFGELLYFEATQLSSGQRKLFVYDKTLGEVSPTNSAIDEGAITAESTPGFLNGQVIYINLAPGNGRHGLYVSSGTGSSADLLLSLPRSSYYGQSVFNIPAIDQIFSPMLELNGQLYFTQYFPIPIAGDVAFRLWTTDGTQQGTKVVKTIKYETDDTYISYPHPGPAAFEVIDGLLYFTARVDVSRTRSGWVTDGTSAGTKKLAEFSLKDNGDFPDSNKRIGTVNNEVYIYGRDQFWCLERGNVNSKAEVCEPGVDGIRQLFFSSEGELSFYIPDDKSILRNQLWAFNSSDSSGHIGDYVWHDLNKDGAQDSNEPGIAGVAVNLWRECKSNDILSTTTDANGFYSFTGLEPGDYQLEFVKLTGYEFSPEKAAGNFELDSNANPSTGMDACRTLAEGQQRPSLDAGLIGNGVNSETLNLVAAVARSQNGKDSLWIRASSDATPEGSSLIIAAMMVNGQEVVLGNLPWRSTKGFYQMNFTNLDCIPETIILRSDSGAEVEADTGVTGTCDNSAPSTDTVSADQAIYFSAQQKLWVRGYSDAMPAGAAELSASMTSNGGETTLGKLNWVSSKSAYQKSFFSITSAPTEITITSNLGGSDSIAVRVVN